MTEHDLWKIHPRMPRKVRIGDITIRDGFQHLEKFISTRAKIYYLEELVFAGCREIEVTNLGNAYLMPQFSGRGGRCWRMRAASPSASAAKSAGSRWKTSPSPRSPSGSRPWTRPIELRTRGIGPDRILMMVSTEEEHHFANSGCTLPHYWKEAEQSIKKAADAGMKMCGTVSTIWGSPIGGATDMKDAVEFTKRWLEIGAYDIEHADHDGSASAAEVYRYFSMVLDAIPDPDLHVAHFHETKRVASASVLAALMAGITRFEGTLGGMGGQPANFLDDCPVPGTGSYYYEDPRFVGLICLEDLLVQVDEMGIEHGYDVDRILWLGRQMEKTVGGRLRSEAAIKGRTRKEGHPQFARPGLKPLKQKLGEAVGQKWPKEWSTLPVLPERYTRR